MSYTTGMKAFLASVLLLAATLAPASPAPIEVLRVEMIASGNIICDTPGQVADILAAHHDHGLKASKDVFIRYLHKENAQGMPSCGYTGPALSEPYFVTGETPGGPTIKDVSGNQMTCTITSILRPRDNARFYTAFCAPEEKNLEL